ncbi:hypothetical protein WN943_006816 [Citrus x changshan-huyou]
MTTKIVMLLEFASSILASCQAYFDPYFSTNVTGSRIVIFGHFLWNVLVIVLVVNLKMAKIVDKGNETNFKENDDVNQQNEILRKNQPFIEKVEMGAHR